MGEARERFKMGLQPRMAQQGQQVQVDLTNSIPKVCECGCKYFIPAVSLAIVPALVSPVGQELLAQIPALICLECKKALEIKNPESQGN